MAAFTSQRTGNWSDTSTSSPWYVSGGTPCAIPGAGDTATIANDHVVTVDVNTTVGSNGSSVGHAITINGASSSNYGRLLVSSGVTLTLRGTDTTTNTLMLVNRYGRFEPQAGSTIVGDVASDYASIILNKGIISALGSAGSPITWTQPSGNISWSNSISGETPTNGGAQIGLVGSAKFANDWIANAAGSGPGSAGDTSVSFGGTNASAFVTPVASPSAIASSGDYYVDHDLGNVWVYWTNSSTAPSFTVSYKYCTFGGTAKGWGIQSTQNTDYNQAIFDYCTFQYLGQVASGDNRAIAASNKKSATVTANSLFQLTNSTIANCYKAIGLKSCDGASGDLLRIEYNTIGTCRAESASGLYGYNLTCYRSQCTYVSVSYNTIRSRFEMITVPASGAVLSCSGWQISHNTITWLGVQLIPTPLAALFPDSEYSYNVCYGAGSSSGRCLQDVGGSSGHPFLVHDNQFYWQSRSAHYCSYLRFYNNIVAFSTHHGMPASLIDDAQLINIYVYNNLFLGQATGSTTSSGGYGSPNIEIGYNHRHWIDDIQIVNNTLAGDNVGGVGFGDCQDTNAYVLISKAVVANNLVVLGNSISSSKAWQRASDSTTNLTKLHCLQYDYNLDYNYISRYVNLTRQGTFTQGGANYNAIASGSRNCPGVALFNPSFSSKSGGSVTLVVTSATVKTIAWGAGTPVSLVVDSGTLSSNAAGTTTAGGALFIGATLTDSTKSGTWLALSGNANNTNSRGMRWVMMTSGTQSGQVRAITNNTTTTLTVVPAFSTLPLSGDSYAILESEVTCTDGSETVKIGLDWRDVPTAANTYTDSSISFADHSVTGSDPLLVAGTSTTAAGYKWTTGSPAKNAATSDNAPATDYFGGIRPSGAGYDIGFFEFIAGGLMFHLRRLTGGFVEMG